MKVGSLQYLSEEIRETSGEGLRECSGRPCVTPFSAAQAVARGYANVAFHAVPGGHHDNSYVLARGAYLVTLHGMLAPLARMR